MNHDEASELIAVLALDAVEGDELAAIEEHMVDCPHCQSEFDSMLAVAGALGNSVEPLPEHLWDSIASRIYEDRDHEVPMLTLFDGNRATKEPEPRSARPNRFTRVLAVPLAIAAVIVAVLAFQLVNANGRVSNLQTALNATDTDVKAALLTPGHRLIDLKGASEQQLAEFVMLPSGQGYLVSSNMPLLASGKTYQLWGIIGGKSISIGLMGSAPGHVAFTMAGSPTPSELAVTIEPAGGTQTPTSQVVAAGTV